MLTCGNKKVNGFVVGIFTTDDEVSVLYGLPILRRDLLLKIIETLHRILQLLPQPVHHGCPGPVRRRTGSTARQAPVRRVGAVQRLELDFDQLGLLESEGHVGVHAGSEVLHGLGVVESLGIVVRGAQRLVEAVELLELVFDGLDVFEELVEVNSGVPGRAHLDIVVVVIGGGLFVAEAREGAGK